MADGRPLSTPPRDHKDWRQGRPNRPRIARNRSIRGEPAGKILGAAGFGFGVAARVSLRGKGKNFSRGCGRRRKQRESLRWRGGWPLFKAPGEEPESCGEQAHPTRLRASRHDPLTDRLALALGGAACQWAGTVCRCREEPCAAPPRRVVGPGYAAAPDWPRERGSRLQRRQGRVIPRRTKRVCGVPMGPTAPEPT